MNDATKALALSTDERNRYAKDGYFVRPAVFGAAELDALRDAAEQAVRRADAGVVNGRTYFLDGKRFVDVRRSTIQYEHTPASQTMRVLEPAHLFAAGLDRLLDDARLTVPMQGLVASRRLSIWTCKLNLKRAAEGSGFGWHQDSPYWIHDCAHVDRLPNAMLALDPQTLANGCLRVIRGSHRRGMLPGGTDGSQLSGFFTAPDCFALADQRALEVPAGSLIFFSPHTVHGSQPNASPHPRRAVILTYQPGNLPMLKTGTVRNVASQPAVAGACLGGTGVRSAY